MENAPLNRVLRSVHRGLRSTQERWRRRRALPDEIIDRLAQEMHYEPGRAEFRERFSIGESGLLLAEDLRIPIKHLNISSQQLDRAHSEDLHRVLEAAARTPYAVGADGEQQSFPEEAVRSLHQNYAAMLSTHPHARPERAYFGQNQWVSIAYIGIGWQTEVETLSVHGPYNGLVVLARPSTRYSFFGPPPASERDVEFIYRNRSAEVQLAREDWADPRHAPSSRSPAVTYRGTRLTPEPHVFKEVIRGAAGIPNARQAKNSRIASRL